MHPCLPGLRIELRRDGANDLRLAHDYKPAGVRGGLELEGRATADVDRRIWQGGHGGRSEVAHNPTTYRPGIPSGQAGDSLASVNSTETGGITIVSGTAGAVAP